MGKQSGRPDSLVPLRLVRDTIGHPLAPSERRNYEDIVNEVQNALGGEPFAIEWDRGKIMKLEDVANEVMELV